jgi:hypothetical protein
MASLATEYAFFAAWNAATGKRAGTDGYAEAATYPMVAAKELDASGVSGATTGLGSIYYHVAGRADAPLTVDAMADPTRTAVTLLRLDAGGRATLAGATALDVATGAKETVASDAIVVVSGTTTKRSDANYTLHVAPAIADGGGDSGSADGGSGSVDGGDSGSAGAGDDTPGGHSGCSIAVIGRGAGAPTGTAGGGAAGPTVDGASRDRGGSDAPAPASVLSAAALVTLTAVGALLRRLGTRVRRDPAARRG